MTDMPRARWKAIHVQLGITADVDKEIRRLILDVIEDRISYKGRIETTELGHWALHYVLTVDPDEAVRLLKVGKACQEQKEAAAKEAAARDAKELPAEEPEESNDGKDTPPGTPASTPVSKASTKVWTRGKKPRKGNLEGLDSKSPARRKVSNPPRGK
jgi:hypothetical protein